MSDQTPKARRPGPLILPVAPPDARVADESSPSGFKPLPARPLIRTRAYGAPLLGAKRVVGPAPGRVSAPVPEIHSPPRRPDDAPPESAAVPADEVKRSTPSIKNAPELTQKAAVPVVFWDMPPRPEIDIDEPDLLPAWASDLGVAPTEQQYLELGTFLLFMVDGFADFCRAAPVLESGQWQGRMQMPKKVLPDTMLQLEVSAFNAKLRFETEHPVSREILHRHREALHEQVSAALDDDRQVEVSIW